MKMSCLVEDPDETTDTMVSQARMFGLHQLIRELLVKNQVLRERLRSRELPFSDPIAE
jgi:hypothetical protein